MPRGNILIRTLGTLMLLLLLVSVNGQVTAIANVDGEIESSIDEIFSDYNSPHKPGGSIAVVRDGELVFAKGYGSANLEYEIPNTAHTIFHVASVSKQFTVFAILLLEADGKLSIDDDIRDYIPEVPDFGYTITLRDLATHTSGMRDQWNLLALAGWRLDDVITTDNVFEIVKRQKELNFMPGEEYLYCNTGFTLLAEVVTRVSGKPFAEFTSERIFQPLEMTNTLFYDDHEKIVKYRAYSYHLEGDLFKKNVLSYANVGATSLFTTAEDMSRWARNFRDVKVGSTDIIELMNTEAVLNNGETFGGAMGQFVNEHKGHRQIQHGGSDAGYRSYFARFPDDDLAVVVLSNLANFNPRQKALDVADLFLEDQTEPPRAQATMIRDELELNARALKKYEGYYWNDASAYSRRLYVRDDTLRYFRNENNESPLLPVGVDAFEMAGVNVELIVRFGQHEGEDAMFVTIDGDEPIISIAYEPADYSSHDLQHFAGDYYSPELETTYSIREDDGNLVAEHIRTGTVILDPIKEDFFRGNRWYFGLTEFIRDNTGEIVGLQVSSGRVRNLRFERVFQDEN